MAKAAILVIEDDPEIRELMAVNFAREGWLIIAAEDGEKGLSLLESSRPSCIILDIMLPGMDGLEVLRRLKAAPGVNKIPVIMTTARGEDSDIVTGLELGADDYVVKPFSPRVLAARVRAALRRNSDDTESASEDGPLVRGRLFLDPLRHEVRHEARTIDLSATEFAILMLLMRSPGRVFTRSGIIDAVKGPDYPVTDRSVDVQILQLRKKLGEAGELVETVRGVGYRFKVEQ
jgi:two-component system alkaline phosphatase synthesis response regulator PhoP